MRIRPQPLLAVLLAVTPLTTAFANSNPDDLNDRSDQNVAPQASSEVVVAENTPEIALDWGLTLASRFLFQGFDYSDGKPVAQPEASISYGNLSTYLWMNHDIDRTHVNELDILVQAGHDFEQFWAGVGYGYYRYPNRDDWDPSQEIIFDLAVNHALSPTLTVNYDFDAGTGVYATLGASHALPGQLKSVSAYTNVFYQNGYYDVSGIPSVETGISAEREWGGLALSAGLSRFNTWENDSFKGELAVPAQWLFTLGIAGSR